MNEFSPAPTDDRHATGRKLFSSIQRYRNLLQRRWWVLVVGLVLAVGIQAVRFHFATPEFVSVGQMIVSIKVNTQQSSLYSEELGNFLGTQAALMQGNEVSKRASERVLAQNPGIIAKPVALQVTVLPKTTIFLLRATGDSPEYTKAFLQAAMEEYQSLKKGMAEHATDTTIAGLTDQMLRLEPEMRKIDDQVAAFVSTNDTVALDSATVVANYLNVLYQRQAEAESEFDLLQSMTLDQNLLLEQNRSAMVTGSGASSAQGSGNALLADAAISGQSTPGGTIGMQYLTIKQQILLLKADQERLGEYLKPKHPKMVTLQEEAARLNRLLEIYRDQNLEQLEAKKSALQLQITNLKKQIKEWSRQNIELSHKSAEYTRLKSKSQRVQLLYDQLLATLQTLDVNKEIGPDAVTIYQPASEAFPDQGQVKKGLFLAALMGLGLALVILILLDRVDDRMNTSMELEQLFDEDVLGNIPREKPLKKNTSVQLLQPADLRHAFVEAYRNLRSALLYTAETGTRPHTLLITSSVPNDGKSMTAANLAITLAAGGSRVLLVDGDLRKGTLHNRFEIQVTTGLSDVLSQDLDWHTAVQPTATANLSLLPRGTISHHSGEMFLGPVMGKFLKNTIAEYDYVLIDTAPVMAADDVTSLAPRVDGVIFVVRAEFTSARVVRASLDMLYQRKARILGLVFNSVRASVGEYYYSYKDYYSRPAGK